MTEPAGRADEPELREIASDDPQHAKCNAIATAVHGTAMLNHMSWPDTLQALAVTLGQQLGNIQKPDRRLYWVEHFVRLIRANADKSAEENLRRETEGNA